MIRIVFEGRWDGLISNWMLELISISDSDHQAAYILGERDKVAQIDVPVV